VIEKRVGEMEIQKNDGVDANESEGNHKENGVLWQVGGG
jgi:hypothetical protein